MRTLHKKLHNKSMDPSPQDSQQMPGQIMIPPAPSSKKIILIIALLLILALLAGVFYFRPGFFTSKPSQPTVITQTKTSFDAEKAITLLKDPETIIITKEGQVLLNNPKGEELVLITTDSDFTSKISRPLISYNRNFLTWQSEKGLVMLDVAAQKLSFIQRDLPRQSYDLSPTEDKMLFLSPTHLMEADLTRGTTVQRLALPKLDNPKMRLNQVKYAPNAELAYLRSIYSGDPAGKKEFIVDLKTNELIEITDSFTEPIGLTPLWSNDSQSLLATRENSLVLYNLSDNQLTELATNTEDEEVIGAFGPYSINPAGTTVAYLFSGEAIEFNGRTRFTNPSILVLDIKSGSKKTLLESGNPTLSQNKTPSISDIGWLDNNQLWFVTYNNKNALQDLWVIGADGKDLKKVIPNLNSYSLESVRTPLENIII